MSCHRVKSAVLHRVRGAPKSMPTTAIVALLLLSFGARGKSVPPPLHRVVSTTPAATELLFQLGLGASVVGTPEWSDFPDGAKLVPRIGPLSFPGFETIVRLRPDWVLFDESQPFPDLETAITDRNFATRRLRLRSIEGLFTDAAWLLQTLAHRALPPELLALGKRWLGRRPPTHSHFLLLVSIDPPIAAGPGTFLGDLLARSGGENLCPDFPRTPYPQLALDWVRAQKPDRVFVLTFEKGEEDRVYDRLLQRKIPVIALPSDTFGRPTFTALRAAESRNFFGSGRETKR